VRFSEVFDTDIARGSFPGLTFLECLNPRIQIQ